MAHLNQRKSSREFPIYFVLKSIGIIILLIISLLPSLAVSKVIESDTTWSGEVSVDENILVPKGVTLTISPDTVIRVTPSEGTKTDPEFISFLTEITVRGTLMVNGREHAPVTFLTNDMERSGWAGIIVDGGKTVMRSTIIRDAETGVDVIAGSVYLKDSQLIKNRYGLIVQGPDADVRVKNTEITGNDYGLFLLNGAKIETNEMVVKGNRKKDTHSLAVKDYQPTLKKYEARETGESKIYGDEVYLGTVVWQGRIVVNGTVRVSLTGRLIILPGTVVEFRKKDTNNDGIGENGLFIQGGLIAKGTKEAPIVFRSAEKQKGKSDWDSINILNSDRAQNLIEYCQIENAYRGMHFHFANVAVKNSVLTNNSRGMQFQESIVEVSGTHLYGNNSALWARDSEILFYDNLIYDNYSGINFFRNTLAFKDNSIMKNKRGGLRVREGIPVIERNVIDGNRYGLMVVDAVYGTFSRNVISGNLETGISLRGPVNIEVSGNVVQGNGLYGISIQDSSAVIKGNLISDNGERGIGILSFHGTITGNNIVGNGLYNLGIDGDTDVSAPMNWWGAGDVRSTIFDKENDPSKGRAEYLPIMTGPAILTWPVKSIATDTKWQTSVLLEETTVVEPGIDLAIIPGTSVLFAKDAGLIIRGRIFAKGENDARITFASLKGERAGEWDEIRLEYADGSVFSNCIIRNATWALHVHFTDLEVERCSFENNFGGMRFRSGPIHVSHSSFRGNEIGMRTTRGIALISESVITDNRIGVFVREKGSGLVLRKNNIFANSDYNVRVGDFNDEDLDAKDNWWGDVVLPDKIFDARTEPGIGFVNYEPYARSQFLLNTP